MNTNNLRKAIVSLIVIIILGFLTKTIGSSFSSGEEKPKTKVTVVKHALVQKFTIENNLIIPKIITEGKLNSSQTISVSIEGKGTLNSTIKLKEGSLFNKGQKVAYVIDNQANANFKASLYKYHQTLTNALIDIKIEYPTDIDRWNNFTADIQNGILPNLPTVTNTKLNNYLSAKGIYNLYYDLKSVKTSLNKRSFVAPFKGYISKTYVQSGSFINGTTKICDISPMDKLELTFSLDAQFSSNLSNGTSLQIITNQGKRLKAQITRSSNQINSITQQRDFTAQLTENSNTVLSGDFVKIEIPLTTSPIIASILPAYCVNNNDLFTISKDTILIPKTIKIVSSQNDSLVVTGLNNNEIILLESYTNFTSGQKVRYN